MVYLGSDAVDVSDVVSGLFTRSHSRNITVCPSTMWKESPGSRYNNVTLTIVSDAPRYHSARQILEIRKESGFAFTILSFGVLSPHEHDPRTSARPASALPVGGFRR